MQKFLITFILLTVSSSGRGSSIPGWKETFFYHLAPEKLACPLATEIPGKFADPPDGFQLPRSKVIFSIGLSESFGSKPIELKTHKKLSQRILKYRLKLGLLPYQKIYLSDSDYKKRKEKYESTWMSLAGKKNTLKHAIQWHEGIELRNSYYKIAPHLNQAWSYREASTTGSILRAIQQEAIRHVVIIGHGDENGFLYDSERNPFHLSFFKNLPPWVQSVSLFACHSQKMKALYLKSFEGGESWYQKRYLFTLNEHKHLLKKGEVWSGGFPEFIKYIDKFASKAEPLHNQVSPGPTRQTSGFTNCRLLFNGLHIVDGQWDVTMNRQWIGALDKNTSVNGLNFRCPEMNPSDKTLKLSIYSVNQSWDPVMITGPDWSVSLQWHEVSVPALSESLQPGSGTGKPQTIRVTYSQPD